MMLLPLLAGFSLVQRDIAARADAYMNAFAKPQYFSGAVLVAVDGKPVFRKAYGYADWAKKQPMTLDTPVMLFSITKAFTATALMMLHDQGLIDPHDKVSKFLDPWPKEWDAVTLHHLLTHTSGLNIPSALQWMNDPATSVQPPKTTPGATYEYSNVGYTILARVIAKVSGTPYPDFIRKNIFERLGMAHSGEGGFADGAKEVARGHELSGARYVAFDQTVSDMIGAADLHSTVDDMLKWRLALEGSALLSESSRKAMFTPWVATGPYTAYAYGWAIDKRRGMVGHGGSGASAVTNIESYGSGHIVVIVLRNLASDKIPLPKQGLADIAQGKPVKIPHFVDLAEVNPYQGAYGRPGDMSYVTLNDGELQAEWPSGFVCTLEPLSGGWYKAGDAKVRFVSSRAGWILKYSTGDKEFSNPQIELPIVKLDALAGNYGDWPGIRFERVGRRLVMNLINRSVEFFPTGPDQFQAIGQDARLTFQSSGGKVQSVKLIGKARTLEFKRATSPVKADVTHTPAP